MKIIVFGGLVVLCLLLWRTSTTTSIEAPSKAGDRSVGRQSTGPAGDEPPASTAADAPSRDEGDSPGEPSADADDTDAALARRLDELRSDPRNHVECELDLTLTEGVGYLAIGGHSDLQGRRVQIADGRAFFPLVYDLGDLGDAVIEERSGLLSVEGYGPVEVAWSDPPDGGGLGHCTVRPSPESGRASLTGTLTIEGTGEPAAGAWVEGCGNLAFSDGNGIVHMDIVSEPCTVIAQRQDGMLRTHSPLIDIVPTPGRDVVVDIEIPGYPRGGVGVRVSEDAGGVLVEGLVEGGPGGEAGLLSGDRIIAIDGEPPVDLQDFVERVGGRPGTDVVVTIDRAGETSDITVTRRKL